jgi:hypothetical protein
LKSAVPERGDVGLRLTRGPPEPFAAVSTRPPDAPWTAR